MILVCDAVCWGMQHVPFNAALLETIRGAFPQRAVVFCGEQSHLSHVSMQMSSQIRSSISWEPVFLPPRYATFSHRFLTDLRLAGHLAGFINRYPFAHLVMTNITPSTLVALKLLSNIRARSKGTQVVLHGNLSALNGWRSRNPFLRIQDLTTALTFGTNRNIQYIVLEDSIREPLLRKLPSLRGSVFVLDHPVPPNEWPKEVIDFHPPLRFGFLGHATPGKNLPFFVKIASEMSDKFADRVEFHVTGKVYNHREQLEIASLGIKSETTELNRYQFVQRLKTLHFVCFPYAKQHYELSPSGVLLDAIAWEKPVIASRLAIFEDLFSKFGNIGYLCENEEEFAHVIERIVEDCDMTRYSEQVVAMRKVKRSRGADSLAPKYRQLCQQFSDQ